MLIMGELLADQNSDEFLDCFKSTLLLNSSHLKLFGEELEYEFE